MPVTIFNSISSRGAWRDREEIAAFLTGCEIFLQKSRPDLVWTYGGDPVSLAVQQLAKRLGIPVLFFLHNFSYRGLESFRAVDWVAVPSQFARDYYRKTLGLDAVVLPYAIDPERVLVTRRPGRPHPNPLPEGEGDIRPHPSPLPTGEGTFLNFRRFPSMKSRAFPGSVELGATRPIGTTPGNCTPVSRTPISPGFCSS